jgi:hypothetical protein
MEHYNTSTSQASNDPLAAVSTCSGKYCMSDLWDARLLQYMILSFLCICKFID